MSATTTGVALEAAARELADGTDKPPFLFQLPVEEGRKTLEGLQSGDVAAPDVEIEDIVIPVASDGTSSSGSTLPVRVLRPPGRGEALPAVLYIHGAGWVFGSAHTHDRLIRELCVGADCAVVFPSYDLSPEARYPKAIEQNYATLTWIAERGSEWGLDPARVAVAGDSVGGNMAAVTAILAKERSGPRLAAQLLFYPVTDANFDTGSYREFAEGYYLRRDAMQWFWDQYTTDDQERLEPTASPLRASHDQLTRLPQALVITGEADVLRDEGEAYAERLREAGVPVTAVRYQAIIHDFMMLNALRDTCAAEAAISQANTFLTSAFRSEKK